MGPKSILITGCNRGIGLELVKQYIMQENPPKHIFATYRTLSNELKQLSDKSSSVKLIKLDITDYASYPEVVRQVQEVLGNEGLNLLINNAGVKPLNLNLESITPEDMRTAYEINCIAPLFFSKAMLPLLECSVRNSSSLAMSVNKAAIVHISTVLASIAANEGGDKYPYRCSKTGLNQAMKTMSIDLKGSGILIMSLHPGWVNTDMGGPNADISVETCCTNMIQTLDKLTEKDYASFLRYDGAPIAW